MDKRQSICLQQWIQNGNVTRQWARLGSDGRHHTDGGYTASALTYNNGGTGRRHIFAAGRYLHTRIQRKEEFLTGYRRRKKAYLAI